jgi:uncharacterized protein YecE (DUF72 family)
MMAGKLYFGPAGWSYPDWKGTVYPGDMKGHPLNFLERWFNMVEINTTFYRLPERRMAENWCLIPKSDDFLFTVKLGQNFTHGREEILKSEREGYIDLFRVFKFYNRLGGILIQFPWSFVFNGSNFDYLKRLVDSFREFVLILEVRHSGWMNEEFLGYINKNGISFCNIDQPAMRNNIGLTDIVSSETGYFRFHGRNLNAWFGDTNRDMRYNYLYSQPELDELICKIKAINEKTGKTYVVGNNHFKGQAVINLLQIKEKLTGENLELPLSLKTVLEGGGPQPMMMTERKKEKKSKPSGGAPSADPMFF